MSNVIKLGKLQNIERVEEIRSRAIGMLALKKDLLFKEAERIYENDLRSRAIAKLAVAANITYERAEELHDKAVAYYNRLREIERINEENKDYTGICAEEFETYHV